MKIINRVVSISMLPTYFLIAIAFIANMSRNKLPLMNTYLIIAISTLGFLFHLFIAIKKSAYKNFKYFSIFIFIITYFILLFFSMNDYIYSFAFVVVIVYILYFDLKLMTILITSLNIINILCIAKVFITNQMPTGHDVEPSTLFLQSSCLIVFSLITYYTTKESNAINNEKLNTIQSKKEKTDNILNNVIYAIENLKENITNETNIINELNTTNITSNKLVKNIANTRSTNVLNIEAQTHLTNDIKSLIDNIVENINSTILSTTNAIEEISLSNEKMLSLENESNDIMKYNQNVIHSINKFIDKTNAVKKITSEIVDISSQTNSLAISASIESARAGDAGVGFNVVSSEIRTLAEQTKKLTNEISDVITVLEDNAFKTSDVVRSVVHSISEENSTITSSIQQFKEIHQNINDLSKDMHAILNTSNTIVDSNTEITHHIDELKTTNNEVLDITQTAININENYDKKSQDAKEIMDKLLNSANQLSKYL